MTLIVDKVSNSKFFIIFCSVLFGTNLTLNLMREGEVNP